MTNEEALKLLEMHYDYQEDFNCNDELVTALAFGIHALKKQIPKKPFKNRSEYNCPSCEEHTCVGKNHSDGHKTRKNYCFNCGQAIDWSDENEDTARH